MQTLIYFLGGDWRSLASTLHVADIRVFGANVQ